MDPREIDIAQYALGLVIAISAASLFMAGVLSLATAT